MTLTDCVGLTGVAILLVAFYLNLRGKFQHTDRLYILLNMIGAGIACLASIMLNYWPFIILEGCWTIVSIIGMIKTIHIGKVRK